VGRFDDRLSPGEDYEVLLRVCREGPVTFADIADIRYRVGTLDRLSERAMTLPIARTYLQVLDATLARDRDRMSLSPGMIMVDRSYAPSSSRCFGWSRVSGVARSP
jgi:hypothetical protein